MVAGYSAVRAAVIALALATSLPCSAQLQADPSTWTVPHESVKVRQDEIIDLRTTPEADSKPIDPYAYKRGLFRSMGLYEYKKVGEVPGQYSKPHYAFGISSDAMRGALSVVGIEAENCVAPMFRLRARESSVTGASGVSMSLLARCNFR
jgi:hypothetical protein